MRTCPVAAGALGIASAVLIFASVPIVGQQGQGPAAPPRNASPAKMRLGRYLHATTVVRGRTVASGAAADRCQRVQAVRRVDGSLSKSRPAGERHELVLPVPPGHRHQRVPSLLPHGSRNAPDRAVDGTRGVDACVCEDHRRGEQAAAGKAAAARGADAHVGLGRTLTCHQGQLCEP